MLKNMKKSTKSNVITLGIVVGFYVLIQILSAAGALTNSFSGQLVPICAYVIMAVSLNLTVGMLGELSLGHAGFMSVGAFSGTLVYVVMSENAPQPLALLLAFVVGGAVAGLFGVLVGVPVLRLSGDYLAIVTLAFGEIVKNVMNACYLGVDSHGLHFSLKDSASLNLEADGKVLINGAMGITGIKKASTFTIGIVLVIITLLVILNLVNSRAGRAIKAIRDNEIAARSVGIPITKYKLMAFVTSAVFAGVAGVLYALNYSSLVAKKFDYNTSILILVFVVLGGIGNLRGSVIAAAVPGKAVGELVQLDDLLGLPKAAQHHAVAEHVDLQLSQRAHGAHGAAAFLGEGGHGEGGADAVGKLHVHTLVVGHIVVTGVDTAPVGPLFQSGADAVRRGRFAQHRTGPAGIAAENAGLFIFHVDAHSAVRAGG